MGIKTVTEVGEGRGASEDQDNRESVRRFFVELKSVTDDPIEARDAFGVPNVGDTHPKDSNTFVIDKGTEETANRKIFFVTVNYSTSGKSDVNLGGGQNPLNENPIINWHTRDIQVVAIRGTRVDFRGPAPIRSGGGADTSAGGSGGPILNSAGELYTDPPLIIPDFLQVVVIKRNERPGTGFSPSRVRGRLNSINSSAGRLAGLSFRQREAWLTKYNASEIREQSGTDYVVVTYQIMIARENFTWLDSILDQGLRERIADADGNLGLQPIRDLNKKRVTTPVNLNGAGEELAEGDDPVFLDYLTKTETNFSNLSLPREFSRTGR